MLVELLEQQVLLVLLVVLAVLVVVQILAGYYMHMVEAADLVEQFLHWPQVVEVVVELQLLVL
ncbi:MAG: hypothetical protein EBY28_26550 [Betaproteobacteria bacterium]|nr:hypothetical protein [Betaproteobacteria bacterium]